MTMKRFGISSRTIATMVNSIARTNAPSHSACCHRTLVSATRPKRFPMKAGTDLKQLAIFKGQDAPKTLERAEYPDWVNDLATPQPGLAALRKIPNEQADLDQIKRYLKLTRRQAVRQRNEESAA
mmetsp:Transcript_9064/g.19015  ORF Transcript_9064/g.19015 Transcript_9064/m.19015 type:complete len:125 (-) Transcript_9064:1452-1826(-)